MRSAGAIALSGDDEREQREREDEKQPRRQSADAERLLQAMCRSVLGGQHPPMDWRAWTRGCCALCDSAADGLQRWTKLQVASCTLPSSASAPSASSFLWIAAAKQTTLRESVASRVHSSIALCRPHRELTIHVSETEISCLPVHQGI
jgi:hypothetical protein